MLKKIGKFLSSMQFAIALLILLVAFSVLGSLIPQGNTYEWYAAAYSERAAGAIMALYLDDLYHSFWFIALAGFLCLSLLLCNLVRLPALIRRMKAAADPAAALRAPTDVNAEGLTDPIALFTTLRFPAPGTASFE